MAIKECDKSYIRTIACTIPVNANEVQAHCAALTTTREHRRGKLLKAFMFRSCVHKPFSQTSSVNYDHFNRTETAHINNTLPDWLKSFFS